jgi:hypothetical protein
MPILSIEYDLYKEPGRVYGELIEAIKALGPWCPLAESSWFVSTTMMPARAVITLRPHLHQKDKLLVVKVKTGTAWAGLGLPDNVVKWLRNHVEAAPTTA